MEELEQEGFDFHSVTSLECCVVVQVEGEQVDGIIKHLRVSLDKNTQNKHARLHVPASTNHSTLGTGHQLLYHPPQPHMCLGDMQYDVGQI